MRWAGTFVVTNVLIGLATPGIDQAAHLGGLVTGFLAGLVLLRGWPPVHSMARAARQAAAGLGLTSALVGLYLASAGPVRGRVEHDPRISIRLLAEQKAAAYNAAVTVAVPLLNEFDRQRDEIGRILEDLDRQELPVAERTIKQVRQIVDAADANAARLEALEVEDPEVRELLQPIATGQAQLKRVCVLLLTYFATGDTSLFNDPDGLMASLKAMHQSVESFLSAQQAFGKRFGLQLGDRAVSEGETRPDE
jgi:rhomboid protease GluP